MKRRGSINPMSDRRRAKVDARKEAVALAFARDRGCVALKVWPHTCAGPLDGHEPLPRGRGGDPTDVDNVVIVCRKAHDHLHGHPEWAHEVGLLRRRDIA